MQIWRPGAMLGQDQIPHAQNLSGMHQDVPQVVPVPRGFRHLYYMVLCTNLRRNRLTGLQQTVLQPLSRVSKAESQLRGLKVHIESGTVGIPRAGWCGGFTGIRSSILV